MYEVKYTEEQLKKCGLSFLRNYAREMGGTPGLMKKDELVSYILDIQSGKIAPSRKKSGRKPLDFKGVNYGLFGITNIEYDGEGHAYATLSDSSSETVVKGGFEMVSEGVGAIVNGNGVSAFVPNAIINEYRLKPGDFVEGEYETGRNNSKVVTSVSFINGKLPSDFIGRRSFEKETAIYPKKKIPLFKSGSVGKVADIFCPIGKGQRCLVLYKSGMDEIAVIEKLSESFKDAGVRTVALYANCRPEDGQYVETVCDEAIWTSFEKPDEEHKNAVFKAVERVKRIAESGNPSALLVGSLASMREAFGKDGDVAMKPVFSVAKNTERCESVTLIALTDDEALAEKFRPYCNAFIVTDGKTADIKRSWTRRGESLLSDREIAVAQSLLQTLEREDISDKIRDLADKSGTQEEFISALERL